MSQANPHIKLPSLYLLPTFNLQEEHFSNSNSSIPSFPKLTIPTFHPDGASSKRFNSVDLGSSIVKKIKHNPDILPLKIPSFQLNNLDSSIQSSFPFSESRRDREEERLSSQIFGEKAKQKRKTKIHDKKEVSSMEEKNLMKRFDFNSLTDSSHHSTPFEALKIPKFVNPEPEQSEQPINQASNSLQNALQALQQKLLSSSHYKNDSSNFKPQQTSTRPSMKKILNDYFMESYIHKSHKLEIFNQTPLVVSDSTSISSENTTQSTDVGPKNPHSIAELSKDKMSLDNLDQIYNSDLEFKKEEDRTIVSEIVKETTSEDFEASIKFKTRSDSSASTAASCKTDEKESERKDSVSTAAEITEIDQPDQRSTELSIQGKPVEIKKVPKVDKKVIQKKKKGEKKAKNAKARTRSSILISRWDLASQRRKNRWQLTKKTRRTSLKSTKKVIKIRTPAPIVLDVNPEDVHETPVGLRFQVPKLPQRPTSERNPRRGAPKLMWNPKSIRKGVLDFYFRKLCGILDYEEINEEKAIRLLREEGNDVKKALTRLEGKEKEYAKNFSLKPRRR